jgi:diguanylate cyclase (GGDEF)-like protein
MLDPSCTECGGTLRPVPASELQQAREEDAITPASRPAGDGTSVFALVIVAPWLLPLVGLQLADVAFLAPLTILAFAAARLLAPSRRSATWGLAGRAFGIACALAAAGSGLMLASSIVAGGTGRLGFSLGAAASISLLVGATLLARGRLRRAGLDRLVDSALLALVVGSAVLWFIVRPALAGGDLALTAVVVVDLAALVLVHLYAAARGSGRHDPGAWWITGALATALAGDALVAVSAAGDLPEMPWLTALCWSMAGFCLATGAEHGVAGEGRSRQDDAGGRRWVLWRVLAPLSAVLAFPAIALALWLDDHATTAAIGWFTGCFLLALVLAFGRQAHLVTDHRRAALEERRLRHEATLRNEELEALTGLATTMTQTLEEAPIIEQALGVLHSAARATSAALHLDTPEGPRIAAAAGAWQADRTWVADGDVRSAVTTTRGRRAILRLPLAARGKRIGVVTFVRRETDPFGAAGIELLRLLVDQMAIAVQNARDYREKLEQAIRDPLTGLYNRRFFLEALDLEVARSDRYGSEASLVIFDVDDFKQVNDSYGHGVGDDVLRAIARTAEQVVRPADSFARIGGEEFALLLPQTTQMEALLVAERLRTAISRQSILSGRKVTLSGGLASCPSDAREAEELQRRADTALYWAKRNGKDLCAVASEASETAVDSGAESLVSHLYALVAMIDARHLHTRDHSENVAAYAVALGQQLGLERERIVKLRRAAMLHDVGKIGVRSAVLEKPSRLTDAEFLEIREHAPLGGRMLTHAGLHEEAPWVRAHHERYDGRGYPDGIAGEEIPLEARIIFVADAFEAMTSDRPYSAGVPVDVAVHELRSCAGTQFDPQVVDCLEHLLEREGLTVLALRNR